jgi:hypothetical protein
VTVTKEHILVHHSPTLLGPWRVQLAHPHVAGSFTDGVIGIFHSLNPSGCSLILGSTQPERVAGVSSGA